MRYLAAALLASVSLLSAGRAFGRVPGNVKLAVVESPKGPTAQGSRQVRAEALVVGINTSEQLKPLAIELVEHLKSTYPNCRTYTVVISHDARMLKIGNYLAIASAKDGKTVVTGGIPTAMDIRVMRASHVPVRRPDEQGMKVVYEVALLRKDAAKKGTPLSDDRVYARIARKLKLPVAQVRQLDREITKYYKAFEGQPF